MNPTSQNPEQEFPLSSEPNTMNNKTLIATLATSASIAFMFTLLLYVLLSDRNPISALSPRLPYALFVSVMPAMGAYALLKLTNLFISWWGAVIVYLALFVLGLFIQAFAR